jgi:hypothetical protein
MATAKQSSIRFGPEDLRIIGEVQQRTGLFSMADALRFILRQYAQANGIELTAKSKPKPKRK